MKQILVKPLFTEKNTKLQSSKNQYSFIVDYNANKFEIKEAVEKKFEVKVKSVNTVRYKGKFKHIFRVSGRFVGKTPRFKKAYITLLKGETINLFEQV
ncbi:MAG: 50S ribosomal protein L23 [Ignavibacteriaceae bacterium]|nr:50S ribosomal protein L23 [Ignavibacteriaceae bacterium]